MPSFNELFNEITTTYQGYVSKLSHPPFTENDVTLPFNSLYENDILGLCHFLYEKVNVSNIARQSRFCVNNPNRFRHVTLWLIYFEVLKKMTQVSCGLSFQVNPSRTILYNHQLIEGCHKINTILCSLQPIFHSNQDYMDIVTANNPVLTKRKKEIVQMILNRLLFAPISNLLQNDHGWFTIPGNKIYNLPSWTHQRKLNILNNLPLNNYEAFKKFCLELNRTELKDLFIAFCQEPEVEEVLQDTRDIEQILMFDIPDFECRCIVQILRLWTFLCRVRGIAPQSQQLFAVIMLSQLYKLFCKLFGRNYYLKSMKDSGYCKKVALDHKNIRHHYTPTISNETMNGFEILQISRNTNSRLTWQDLISLQTIGTHVSDQMMEHLCFDINHVDPISLHIGPNSFLKIFDPESIQQLKILNPFRSKKKYVVITSSQIIDGSNEECDQSHFYTLIYNTASDVMMVTDSLHQGSDLNSARIVYGFRTLLNLWKQDVGITSSCKEAMVIPTNLQDPSRNSSGLYALSHHIAIYYGTADYISNYGWTFQLFWENDANRLRQVLSNGLLGIYSGMVDIAYWDTFPVVVQRTTEEILGLE